MSNIYRGLCDLTSSWQIEMYLLYPGNAAYTQYLKNVVMINYYLTAYASLKLHPPPPPHQLPNEDDLVKWVYIVTNCSYTSDEMDSCSFKVEK